MITQSDFKPLWYLRNAHLQTIMANIVHPPFPQVRYETVALPDGDTLQLAHGRAHGPNTVLILHGLEGSLHSAYAQRLMNYLDRADIPAAFMFFRGCNGRPNNQVRSYHSGETADLKAVIRHLKQNGSERIALVGYSLGGNVTLKYMGEGATDDAISCATAISVPMRLDICAARMNEGFSKLYQHTLLRRLIQKVQQKQQLMHQAGFSCDPKQMQTFVEFDDVYTAPIHGFNDATHYYQSCSSRQYLQGIKKPTLIIHSKDDPFMTPGAIPDGHELATEVTLELSPHGGHVGFITGGFLKPSYWLEPRIHRFLQKNFF
ncbi:MAG: hydrolase [Gammaproteobacteria bacterium]|nr:hydrolase [Gammaproteobacteria bacterium]